MYFTEEYIQDVLQYELKIRGYKRIKFKKKNNTLEVKADGLTSYVYNLNLLNPLDEMKDILMSVLRQLENRWFIMYFTQEYIQDVLQYELKIRGYKRIKFKKKNNTLEVKADGLTSYVYNLDLLNPLDEMKDILMSVLRQLELEKIKRGDTM